MTNLPQERITTELQLVEAEGKKYLPGKVLLKSLGVDVSNYDPDNSELSALREEYSDSFGDNFALPLIPFKEASSSGEQDIHLSDFAALISSMELFGVPNYQRRLEAGDVNLEDRLKINITRTILASWVQKHSLRRLQGVETLRGEQDRYRRIARQALRVTHTELSGFVFSKEEQVKYEGFNNLSPAQTLAEVDLGLFGQTTQDKANSWELQPGEHIADYEPLPVLLASDTARTAALLHQVKGQLPSTSFEGKPIIQSARLGYELRENGSFLRAYIKKSVGIDLARVKKAHTAVRAR